MKRILLLMACLYFGHASSQNESPDASAGKSENKRRFGIIGGVDNPILTQGILEGVNFQVGTGIQVGVFYEMDLNRTIYFRPRLIYSQQGDRATEAVYNSYSSEKDLDYRLNYINLPLDIKFWNKVYVVIGPQIGFLIDEKAKGPKYSGPAKSSVDFGANLGMGVSFKQTFIELGVYQGLVPAIEASYWSKTKEYHNALIRFSVGWRIL